MNLVKFMFTELFIISFREHIPQHEKFAVSPAENGPGEGFLVTEKYQPPLRAGAHRNKLHPCLSCVCRAMWASSLLLLYVHKISNREVSDTSKMKDSFKHIWMSSSTVSMQHLTLEQSVTRLHAPWKEFQIVWELHGLKNFQVTLGQCWALKPNYLEDQVRN